MKIYFAGNLAESRESVLKKISFGMKQELCRLASYYYLEWFEIVRKVVLKEGNK